jgi:hypothetical protein
VELTGIEAAEENARAAENPAGSSQPPQPTPDEPSRVAPTCDEPRPLAVPKDEPSDAALEALYLAAVGAERWDDAAELRQLRRARRERAAGNVVPIHAKTHQRGA